MKKTIQFLLCCLLLLVTKIITAQTQNYEWAIATKGTESIVKDFVIQLDRGGNIYEMGSFAATTDFDPGTGTTMITPTSARNLFIQKLDTNGNLIWVKHFQGTGTSLGYHMVTDKMGNVYVTGDFSGTVDFDPNAGTNTITSNIGNTDIFVVKLDSTGALLWANAMGGSNQDQGHAIALDKVGNVYVTGKYRGTVDFDPGIGTFDMTPNGFDDFFIQKLDAAGNFVWAKSVGSAGANDFGYAITTDRYDGVYVTGKYGASTDFDPGAGTFTLVPDPNGFDAFVLKLDTNGFFRWAGSMGGTSFYDRGNAIVADTFDNIYVVGNYRGTVDFDISIGGTSNVSASGSLTDVFIQKLDTGGVFDWAKSVGSGSADDNGADVRVDAYGNIYVTGSFKNTADFDPGAGMDNHTSAGQEDIFILKTDSVGVLQWAKTLGGTTSDNGLSIAVDEKENVYATGDFSGTVDFDPGTGTADLTASGTYDIFILKLSKCAGGALTPDITNLADSISECAVSVSTAPIATNNCGISFTGTPDVSFPITAKGTTVITWTYNDGNGNINTQTQNVIITPIDSSVTQSGFNLMANATGSYTYKWLDCNNGNTPIGVNTQSYNVTVNGNYAVEISNGSCSVTSDCINITTVGLGENVHEGEFIIYPNPTKEFLIIKNIDASVSLIEIIDVTGKVVKSISDLKSVIDVSDLSKGVYFMEVQSDRQSVYKRFVKE